METKFKRIKYIILDENDVERNFTYSYNRAIQYAISISKHCGKSKIKWVDTDTGCVNETFFSNEE